MPDPAGDEESLPGGIYGGFAPFPSVQPRFSPLCPVFLPQIAIYGTNFCTSARNAFFLLMRNIIRVAVLDKVTDFLFFLGKLLIVGSVGILAFFFFTQRIKLVQDTAPSLNYYWVPILTVIVGSYLIAHGFFSVYSMCVDTLFLCFCEDLERNDGSPERPYYMSPELSEILLKGHLEPSKSADSQG
ncbi:choline transporter-like protein 2 [Malurus melanocephalus]|uniref:choline transporter-like protein 2 n=1 Tax=Malurus melanocephalus TaxID=175006 RepID=UPI002547B7BA|nr:choline transporter-like protein 2 [Malurus melanocephalus]